MKVTRSILCIIITVAIVLINIDPLKKASASDYVKYCLPTIIDGTDYSKVVSDFEFVKNGFSGIREDENDDVTDKKNCIEKNSPNHLKEPNRASWIELSNTGSFYYYAQELYYSCGPACVKMALKYLTGTTYLESTICAGCNTTATNGTTFSDMCTYINGEQNSNYYIKKTGATKDTMTNDLYNGIAQWSAPPIVGLQESTTLGWPFNLSGHGVTVYAVKSDKTEVMIADPWAGYVSMSSTNKWYSKSVDDVYTAYSAISAGYMY